LPEIRKKGDIVKYPGLSKSVLQVVIFATDDQKCRNQKPSDFTIRIENTSDYSGMAFALIKARLGQP
jgi:hypothetical protein